MSILCSMVGASFGTVSAVVEVLRRKTSVIATGVNVSTTQSKFGGSSAFFDGTSTDLLAYRGMSSNPTGDMTLEGWIYLSALPATGDAGYMMFLTMGGNDYANLYQTNKIQLAVGGRYGTVTTPAIFAINTWYHLAIVRSSGTYKVYWNGTDCGAFTNDSNWPPPAPTFDWPGVDAHFGRFTDTRGDWFGYMDELRISKIARYTANFTPSTTPFVNDANTQLLIHADGTHLSTYFEDDNGVRLPKTGIAGVNAQISNLQSKFGNTSFLLNGTTDTRIIVNDSISETGAYTIELWFRKTANAGDLFYVQPETTGRAVMYIAANGDLLYDTYSTGTPDFNNTGSQVATALANNVWYHLAYVREASNTVKIFLDGVLKQTGTSNVNLPTGGVWFGSRGYTGNIDEIRVSNIARYTGNFTPATAPFVNDINTTLLYHADGTDGSTVIRDDNGLIPFSTRTARTLTAQGNAQVDTAQFKYGSSALLCDGTGDYVVSPAGTQWEFGTSSFTIEYWIRFNAINTLYVPICLRTAGGNIFNGEWWCEITAAENKMYWGFKNQAGTQYYVNLALAGTAFATGQFYHIALVNNAGTAQMYVNGTATGATTALSGSFGGSGTNLNIGAYQGLYSVNGWMDEVRISKTARYTANFTTSTGPFNSDSNTVLLMHMEDTDASTTFTDDVFGVRTQKGIAAVGNAQVDTAQSKFGGAAALFDGTGDYLQIANSSDFNFGSNNFTVEGWVRANNFTGSPSIMGMATIGAFDGWNLQFGGDGKLYIEYRNSDSPTAITIQVGTAAFSAGTWGHFAFVRSGNTIYAFKDGTLSQSASLTWSIGTSTSPLIIGDGYGINTSWSTATDFNGHLDEIRISNTARYTAAFTPSTTPFQNDANTVLLLHMDGTDASTVFFDDNGIAPYTL